MKYYIRTTLERTLDKSFQQVDYELLIDYEHKPTKAFIEHLKQIQNEDCILLEDDIILCNNFKEKIESVIKNNPNEIINFFTFPNMFIVNFKWQPDVFCYNQCTYYPSKKIKQILEYIDNHKKVYDETSPEKVCKEVFKGLNLTWFTYRPCLVQHLDNGSLLNHIRPFSRRSPYFVDYLDELGITYEEARLPLNKKKLIDLMHEKFKEVDSK